MNKSDYEYLIALRGEYKKVLDGSGSRKDAQKTLSSHMAGHVKDAYESIVIVYKGDYLLDLNDFTIYLKIKYA